MGWLEGKGLLELDQPVANALTGQGVHQVQADVLEPGPLGHLHRLAGSLGIVPPPEVAQHAVVQGLYAEAQALDTASAQSPEQLGIGVIRIDLHGPGRAVADIQGLERAEQSLQAGQPQSRRGSPTQVDGVEGPPG